jgi:hypothetical protein
MGRVELGERALFDWQGVRSKSWITCGFLRAGCGGMGAAEGPREHFAKRGHQYEH